MKISNSEWYSDDNLATLLQYFSANDIYIADTNYANSDKELINHLIKALESRKAQIIIPLNVNALTGELGDNTNHWVGLYIIPNYDEASVLVHYVDPMGFPINNKVQDSIKEILSCKFTVQLRQPLLNSPIQYVQKISEIELFGNIDDCGPMLVPDFRHKTLGA